MWEPRERMRAEVKAQPLGSPVVPLDLLVNSGAKLK
jgi:hypothetical protein